MEKSGIEGFYVILKNNNYVIDDFEFTENDAVNYDQDVIIPLYEYTVITRRNNGKIKSYKREKRDNGAAAYILFGSDLKNGYFD